MRRFNGSDYQRDRDDGRLSMQYDRVFAVMKHGDWMALFEIGNITGDPPASISAQLRHMRKARFGSHTINKRLRGESDGLWEYQLVVNTAAETDQTSEVPKREGATG
jgi:hypothetical protein